MNRIVNAVMRTESPDNDSAFSDSVSLFSSESSTSSSTTPSTNNQVLILNFVLYCVELKVGWNVCECDMIEST